MDKRGEEFDGASKEANRLHRLAEELRRQLLTLDDVQPSRKPLDLGVRIRLERAEQSALQQLRIARAQLREVVSDIPSFLPPPDRIVRIQSASKEVRFCQRRHAGAARRLLVYLQNGTIPDEDV